MLEIPTKPSESAMISENFENPESFEDPESPENFDGGQWFVMRDFKKSNAKSPAYKELPKLGVRCFTPMHWVVTERSGRKKREYVPLIQNLLFIYGKRETLDPIVARTDKLQYQFVRGAGPNTPMVVPTPEMERFIKAVNNDESPVYFTPSEMRPEMIGKTVVINGGPLNGYSGRLLSVKGSKKRRLLVEIKNFVTAAVEVSLTLYR